MSTAFGIVLSTPQVNPSSRLQVDIIRLKLGFGYLDDSIDYGELRPHRQACSRIPDVITGCYRGIVSARRAKAARRQGQVPVAVPPWDGAVSRERIAEVVTYVVERDGRERYGLVPEQLCLFYGVTGAMMCRLATGRRFAVQVGGRAVHDWRGARFWSYGPGFGEDTGDNEFHTWCSPVPPGVPAEALWDMPPWSEVIDFTTGNSSGTSQAVQACGRPPLPPWIWDRWPAVRDRFGLTYRADREATMFRLASTGREGFVEWPWMHYVSVLCAGVLGLDMGDLTPLVPGSFVVGHRSRALAS